MAIDLTLKSVALTNRDATPRVLNNPGLGEGAVEKVAYGYIASVTNALSITSIIRLVSVPSHCIVTGLDFQSAAQTAGKVDIGVYRTIADGGAIAFPDSDDFFATDVDLASAVVLTDKLNESTVNTIALQGKKLWDAIGMATDPKCMLDICCIVSATDVTTGGGALSLRVRYVE